jgi:hypothetical protein
MAEQALARILGILACAGFIWVGIGFAGFAITTALAPYMGVAASAAFAALVLLIVPVLVVAIFGSKGPAALEGSKPADSALAAIAALAKERPVMAMIGASLLGAAEVLVTKRRSERK